jgi:hypothetical protein
LPHILSDNLYNKTGYEGEEIVYHVQDMLAEDKLNKDLVDLIIREAYAVEQGKEKSFQAFEKQMAQAEAAYKKMGVAPPQGAPGYPGMPPMDPMAIGGGPGMPPMDPMAMGGMPPMDPMGMMGGMPPMDPMAMGGMPPMDPMAMGGMSPMDPMSMMGGMPPMDPMAMGGMPPMNPMGMGGMPPMDPMAMGGMPPMDPMAMMGGMPPAEGDKNGKARKEDELYLKFMEIMSKSEHKNPMDDPELQKLMKENAPPNAAPMFDQKLLQKIQDKEQEFITALPKLYVDKIEKERDAIMKMEEEYAKAYQKQMAEYQNQQKSVKK